MQKFIVIGFLLLALGLSGCGSDAASAAEPVEAYLQAIVAQDTDRISTLVCSDWADSALLEVDAFMGVQAELQDVACKEQEVSGDEAAVTCSGQIVATYNNEQQQFPLEGRTYRVTRTGGEWLVCGYQ